MKQPKFTLHQTLGFIGVGLCVIGLLILPWFGEIDISEFVTQVAVVLFALGISIVAWTFKPNIDKLLSHVESNLELKIQHTKELNEKIFKRLATLNIREDTHSNYKLYINKDVQQDDPHYSNIIYTKGDSAVIPLDKLPQPYYEWAFKHLDHKEYADKMLNPFKKLEKLLGEYNSKESQFRENLEKTIETKLSDSFPDCIIYTKPIRRRIEEELWIEKPEHRFADLIKDRISQDDAIIARGFPIGHPYMTCKTITDEQLEQFKDILKSIMNDDEFLSVNKKQMEILKEINTIHKNLKDNFKKLSDELEASGIIIEGTCKLPY